MSMSAGRADCEPYGMGDEHEDAAGCPSVGNAGDGGRGTRAGANGAAGIRTGEPRDERRRIDPGPVADMEPSVLSLVRAAGIGPRPGDQQVAWTAAARW